MQPIDPAWVALSLVEHLGAKKLRAVASHFDGDLRAAIAASPAELRKIHGIGPKLASAIRSVNVEAAEADIHRWQLNGLQIIPYGSAQYPQPLNDIPDPPATLFLRGFLPDLTWSVGVVGTRQPGATAVEAADKLAFALAETGAAVISGLALGIDTRAHLGALAHPRGQTTAVLGGGVLNVYPRQNRGLADAIIKRGGLLSEVHPEVDVTPSMLVARNRLISALSRALVVIETSVEGGAMHAARRAFEQGRTVYALDLPATGNQALIAGGAHPVSPSNPQIPRS